VSLPEIFHSYLLEIGQQKYFHVVINRPHVAV